MSNSKLVSYTRYSPNHSGHRQHKIDTITIHCVVGQCSVETLGNIFASPNRRASCNYGVGRDGKVLLCVDETKRSWCTSSRANDNRAVTIECASDTYDPYAVTSAAYAALLDLVTDICRRNGCRHLIWFGDKAKTLSYSPKQGEMVMTVHRWFAPKSCPGDWLYSRHGAIAAEVNRRLSGSDAESPAELRDDGPQLVRINTTDLNIRKGPGTDFDIVGTVHKPEVYTVVAQSGGRGAASWGQLKSGAGWISMDYTLPY